MRWLDRLKVRYFPPVTSNTALDIARQVLSQSVTHAALIRHGYKPASFNIYASFSEPCWWIVVPWDDDMGGFVIRSSRVIAVGRQTGKVHYDGSADDEG